MSDACDICGEEFPESGCPVIEIEELYYPEFDATTLHTYHKQCWGNAEVMFDNPEENDQ